MDDKAADQGEDKPVKHNDHSCDELRYAAVTTRAQCQRHVPLRPWNVDDAT